ncbi:MAG: YcaQ family DNA glycosylase [Anaerolineae bacterium]|nr:YcaQ family DNA glycosylase [Anaerolineae bacterium]
MAQTPYPLSALRAVALHTQRLDQPYDATPDPTPDVIYETVEQIGCVQIDTLHMVARAQYVTIWSRLGSYDLADFDRLIYSDGERRLFEYWGHAASIIPLRDYRYRMHYMQEFTDRPWGRFHRWIAEGAAEDVLDAVRERMRQDGGVRASDFDHKKGEAGSWWNWKPAKLALEFMYTNGEAMIADRVNFQRVYDLRERVLPDWVDTNAVPREEAYRFFVEQGLLALGVARPEQIAEYAYLKRGEAAPHVKQLIEDDIFIEVRGTLFDGSQADLVVHRDNAALLEQAADGAITAQRTTFLNPFDSLFWARDRDVDLWGFSKVLEAYKKEKDRIWGYYVLPILHKDRLIGRFDPKLDRKTGTLYLRSLYLQEGVELDEGVIDAVTASMRDFLAWQGASEVVIEKSDPGEFGDRLVGALGN